MSTQEEHSTTREGSSRSLLDVQLEPTRNVPSSPSGSRDEHELIDLPSQKGPVPTLRLVQSSDRSAVIAKRSWRAPIVMLASLLSGLLTALGQHGMNTWLNGKPVDATEVLKQRWASNFNIALAFLVKVLFVTCIGTSFVQRQFLNISTKQQPIRVKEFDVLSSGLTNFLSLFLSRIWLKNPLLLLIMLVSWYDVY